MLLVESGLVGPGSREPNDVIDGTSSVAEGSSVASLGPTSQRGAERRAVTPSPFRAASTARIPTTPLSVPAPAPAPASAPVTERPPPAPSHEHRGPVSAPFRERPPPSVSFSERTSTPSLPPPHADRAHSSSGPLSERGVQLPAPVSYRLSQGHLWRITCQLEARHGAFFISRLILMTGIKLRSYDVASPDDPIVIEKLARAIRTLLSVDDYNEILPVLRDRG